MNWELIKELEDRYFAPVYQKMPIAIVRGSGASVWDVNGREYVDCMGGYGAALVGHCNPKVVEAIKRQAERLITCHGSIYNDVRATLLEKLISIAPKGLDRVYLANSGAEAVECALKLAVKYTGKSEIIAMTGSFHGKTIGALSATWNPKYREVYSALLTNVKFAPFGNLEKVEELVNNNTAAIIIEPIQGEGGIHVAPDSFLQGLRELCDRKNVVLIFDEIQSGFGRTGKMWCAQHWNVEPDVMCVAKGIGGGFPIGATLAKGEIMSVFKPGDHTSTFGGNPLACAATSATIDYLLENNLVERAARLGSIFKSGLEELAKKHKIVREVRGLGLMLGLESRFDVKDILLNGIREGVLLLYAGRNVLRFLPPLVIREEQIKFTLDVLDRLLGEEERVRGL
ncbi:MAG: aspartate aminotransferase family protein [Nitrososphaerota archaeon]|nr:aspartate aminotransferase family protein [Nitrososphaerales archaeon]MDW8044523.1 aspartate aminotransferase family protein [Nitrososphaerota archaeon]